MKQTKSKSIPKPTVVSTEYPMRILKEATCPTLSGKGELTYHIGCNAESDIYFTVTSNSGGGFFSVERVSLEAIQAALVQAPHPLTSYALRNLYKGKSANNPAFLMAALKNEGLVVAHPDKQRCFDRVDIALFIAEIGKLQASSINIKTDQVPSFTKSGAVKKGPPESTTPLS